MILVGYSVSAAAMLETKLEEGQVDKLMKFIEDKIEKAPDLMDKTEMMTDLNLGLKDKFGWKFDASLVDAQSKLPADEDDENVLIFVDATTHSCMIH